jgi:hypothetical protein
MIVRRADIAEQSGQAGKHDDSMVYTCSSCDAATTGGYLGRYKHLKQPKKESIDHRTRVQALSATLYKYAPRVLLLLLPFSTLTMVRILFSRPSAYCSHRDEILLRSRLAG